MGSVFLPAFAPEFRRRGEALKAARPIIEAIFDCCGAAIASRIANSYFGGGLESANRCVGVARFGILDALVLWYVKEAGHELLYRRWGTLRQPDETAVLLPSLTCGCLIGYLHLNQQGIQEAWVVTRKER